MLKMNALIDARIGGKAWYQLLQTNEHVSFGSFEFKIRLNEEEKDVCVDWDNYTSTLVSGTGMDHKILSVEMGAETDFGGEPELSDVYNEQYEKDGFCKEDLTAELLAGELMEIIHFGIDCDIDSKPGDYVRLASLSFEDEAFEYFVDEKVLNRFNEPAIREYLKYGFKPGTCKMKGYAVTDEDIEKISSMSCRMMEVSLPDVARNYFNEIKHELEWTEEPEEIQEEMEV